MSAAAWVEDLTTGAGLHRAFTARGPGVVAGVFAIGIAAQAALLLTAESGGPVPGQQPGQVASARPVTRPEINLQSIVDAHLFGIANLRPGNAQDAPQTTLPLVLTGILANVDESKGAAIIGTTSANAKLKSVGDTLDGGARLHAVFSDRVVLERGGTLESLFLPRSFTMTPQTGGAPPVALGPTPLQRLQQVASNGTLFSQLARITPVRSQNKLVGYRVFPSGGNNSVQAFSKLGLVSGDLLTAVNGTPLDDPTKSAAVLQTLSSAASASVTVQRNGTPMELNLNMEALATTAESAIQADLEAAAAARRDEAAAGTGPGARPGPGFGPGGGFGRPRRGAIGNDGNSGGASRDGGQTQ
jgi:general secretion pathway protein C